VSELTGPTPLQLTGPATLPQAVMARSGGENFPVASRLLGARNRRHLLAIYGFARLTDEIGDTLSGDRLAALDWLTGELDAAYRGEAKHPLLRTLTATLEQCPLPRDPFMQLIEANRVDQTVKRYQTWEQLQGYCELSANPVGELVLGVFGVVSAERVRLSDAICTALQLIEHLTDVAEDLEAGRVYLPARELERFAVSETQLQAAHAGPELKRLIAFQADRARMLLNTGQPLLATLNGRPRLAVAAFIAGGHSVLRALERCDYDVLGARLRRSRLHGLAKTVALLRDASR
jgi:squalene synthase HpnC